jgi:hypothetical protein
MWYLEATTPWQVFFRHQLMISQHVGKVHGAFDLCDIIFFPHLFQVSSLIIFRSIWTAWKFVSNLVRWNFKGNEAVGIWLDTPFGIGGLKVLELKGRHTSKNVV